jgi:hypothetical protein
MRIITRITLLLAVVTGLAFGQAALTSTSLSAALSATSSTLTVASATGMTGPSAVQAVTTVLFIDKEALAVRSISGTVISVQRGYGTSISAHASGAQVYVGPEQYFGAVDKSGSCTSTLELVLPVVNVTNGNIWNCYSSKWVLVRDASGVMRSAVNPNGTVAAAITGATATWTVADFGQIQNNAGGQTLVVTLPAAATVANQSVRIHVLAAQTITLTPASGEKVFLNGSGVASKYLLIAGVVGNFVEVYCDGVSYYVVNYSGVVTKES